MIAEYIAIGSELLFGNVLNINGRFLAEEFVKLGLKSKYQTIVADESDSIENALDTAVKRADIVVLSGGLGPSGHDITKDTVAQYLGKQTLIQNNVKTIEGSILIGSEYGDSQSEILENDKTKIILLPGSPNELKPIFLNEIVPYIRSLSDVYILTRTVKLVDIDEKTLEEKLQNIKLSKEIFWDFYPKDGEIYIHIRALSTSEKSAMNLINPVIRKLKTEIGEYIYTTVQDESLEQNVVDLLLANKLTVSTAESCTGGMIASRLINVSGASAAIKAGYITYSDEAKHKVLGVKKSTLSKYYAVSKETCKEMVLAPALSSKADVMVASTGIAGPGTDDSGKPVGLVYIGCNVKGNIDIYEFMFKGDRQKIRECATTAALDIVRKSVIKYLSKQEFGIKE